MFNTAFLLNKKPAKSYRPLIDHLNTLNASGKFIVTDAIEKLITKTNAHYIILSYSSGGRATAKELNEILNSYGSIVEIRKIDYKKNVMAAMKWTNNWINDIEQKNCEYLFMLKKRQEYLPEQPADKTDQHRTGNKGSNGTAKA